NPKARGFQARDVRGRWLGENIASMTHVIEWIIGRELAGRRADGAEKVVRADTSGPIRHFLCATVDRKICWHRGLWIAVEQAVAQADEAHQVQRGDRYGVLRIGGNVVRP